jgi:hypothetical protein
VQSDEDKREGPDLMVGAFIESILITDLSLAKRVKSIGAFSGFFFGVYVVLFVFLRRLRRDSGA